MHRRTALARVTRLSAAAALGLPGMTWAQGPGATASTAPTTPELAGLTLRGQGRFRYFGLSIYDARLWSAEPVTPTTWADQPLTLELQYARSLVGREIAKRSLSEMRRQGPITDAQAQAWLQAMEAAFPDVKAGDRLSGRHEPGVGAQFFFNGQPRQRLGDALFAKRFFGIWLSPQTSEPALREQLLGSRDGLG